MASHLRPFRGKKATAESENIILRRGEIFFEVPTDGAGMGIGKIKMGDGKTTYSDLPYFSSVDDTIIPWTDTTDTIDSSKNTNVDLLNAFVPSRNIKSLFGTAKQLLVNLDKSVTVNNKKVPFSFGIDQSGNYGYIKDGADTVIPFKSQSDIDNAYKTGYNKGKVAAKIKFASIFGKPYADKVGDSGIITDGTYDAWWIVCSASNNTYQLFPMHNLTNHADLTEHNMNPTDTNDGGYTASEMYTYIHNTVLPILKQSGLNITACDLVSKDVYNDICSKTGKTSADFAGGDESFWLTDTYGSNFFCYVNSDGSIYSNLARNSLGVRPLITVVK